MMFRSKSTFAAGLTACGAMGAALVLTAPAAPAAVTSVSLASGLSFGSSTSYGTGCSYTATAQATPGDIVGFFDPAGTFDPGGWQTVGASGSVTAKWTPSTTGKHNVYAVRSSGEYVSTTATVGNGLNLGFACVVVS
ncbi:hypothetical protein [Nocardia sp. NPDC052566]|uniref:hypothetical protein n=1 Tax=Nocardia sp. NPDC052566 TaxID=3364330 RepID=UPI0037C6703F